MFYSDVFYSDVIYAFELASKTNNLLTTTRSPLI